jgi:hypothetical protein
MHQVMAEPDFAEDPAETFRRERSSQRGRIMKKS